MPAIDITIAVAQMDCVVGETEPNLNKIAHFAGLAKRLGAGLAIFPECATTGYFVGDRLKTLADEPDGPTAKRLSDIARENGINLVCGLYTQENGVYPELAKSVRAGRGAARHLSQGAPLRRGADALQRRRRRHGGGDSSAGSASRSATT